MLVVTSVVGMVLIIGLSWSSPDYLLMVLFPVMIVLASLQTLPKAVPWTAPLDACERTYKIVIGYLHVQKTHVGSFEDIEGVGARAYHRANNGPVTGLVDLRLRTFPRSFHIDYAKTFDEAQPKAERLAKLLDLPLLDPLDTTHVQNARIR